MIHFVIPVYNSEKNLEKNVVAFSYFLNLHFKKDEYEIVLCNDGSKDRTLEIARELEKSLSNIRVVGYSQNRGRGYAIKHAAATCRGEFLIYADLDFQQTSKLENILKMAACLEKNQVVIGSRFLRESETQRIWLRKIVGIIHRLCVTSLFPWLKIKDPDVGFKGFQLPYLRKFNELSRIDRWSWDLETLVIARKNRCTIAEFPLDWNEKYEKYVSSVKLVQDGWEELTGMMHIKRNCQKGLYNF